MILEPQKRISEKALTVWRFSAFFKVAISWILAAVVIFFLHRFNVPLWIIVLLIAVELIGTYFSIYLFPSLKWRRWRYDVREEEIELQEGIFIVKRTLIPMISRAACRYRSGTPLTQIPTSICHCEYSCNGP